MLLNIDVGELPDEPVELYACAHLANVACGGHVGDDASMRHAVELCLAHGVSVGAHPSYPDRAGFGRNTMILPPEELSATVAAQCARLSVIAAGLGAAVGFVKPHGALYHAARADRGVADAFVAGVERSLGPRVTVVGPSEGELRSASLRARLGYAREVFADRASRPDGTLVPRGEPGALVLDPRDAAARAEAAVRGGTAETICVHGDTPGAVAIARAVRDVLGA